MAEQPLAAPESQLKWDNRYLRLAHHVAAWSKDPRAQVGAVVIDAQGRLCAIGYNGVPRQVEDSPARLESDVKLDIIIHAEANALTIAGRGAVGGVIYVYGKPVCAQCAGLIIQSGVTRIVAEEPKEGTKSKWDKVGVLARTILQETKVLLELIPREELMRRIAPEGRTKPPAETLPLFPK